VQLKFNSNLSLRLRITCAAVRVFTYVYLVTEAKSMQYIIDIDEAREELFGENWVP
jgi:hypothetical protein